MFRATFGGKTVQSSIRVQEQLAAQGLPIPPELGRCNSFWNPLGAAAGRGWVLLLRDDLDALDLNALHTLEFEHERQDGGKEQITFSSLVVASEPRNLTPSFTSEDSQSLYLVEVADVRHLLDNEHFVFPINKQYNVRAYAYLGAGGATEYLVSSLNAGSAWTWETMIQDVWNLMSARLGSNPTLPFTPHGTPEGFIFQGGSAWKALNTILARIGCAFKSADGVFSIVQLGATDADTASLLEEWHDLRLHDEERIPIIRGTIPYGVRVFFHRQEQYPGLEQTTPRTSVNWQTASAYSVDIVGPDSASAEPGTYHPIWDDLPAIYDKDNALTNSATLDARAQERSDDYFRQLREDELFRVYSGFMPVLPGSTVKGVVHSEGDGGAVTQVARSAWGYLTPSLNGWTSSRLHAPDLSPSWPAAQAQLSKVIEIANGTPSSGRYDSTVEIRDSAGSAWMDKESVYAIDLRGASSLTAGDKYNGILIGYEGSRPLFAIRSSLATSIDGSGSSNYVARWTDADSLSTGVVRDDASNVGMGVAPSTTALLNVQSDAVNKPAVVVQAKGSGTITADVFQVHNQSLGLGGIVGGWQHTGYLYSLMSSAPDDADVDAGQLCGPYYRSYTFV
jgi:hypothetical protein